MSSRVYRRNCVDGLFSRISSDAREFLDRHCTHRPSEPENVVPAPFSLTRPAQQSEPSLPQPPPRTTQSQVSTMNLASSGIPPNATPSGPQSVPLQPPTSSSPHLNAERDRAFRAQAASDLPLPPGNPHQLLTTMMKACFLANLTKQDQMLLDLAVKYALVTTTTQVLPPLITYLPPANPPEGEGNAHAAAHSAFPSSNPSTPGTPTAAATTPATPGRGRGATANAASHHIPPTHAPSTSTFNSPGRRAHRVMNPDPPSPEPVIGIVASPPRLGQTVDNSLPPLLSPSRDQQQQQPSSTTVPPNQPYQQSPRFQPPVVNVTPLLQFRQQQLPDTPPFVPHHRTATPSRGLLRPTQHHEIPEHGNGTHQWEPAEGDLSPVPIVHQPQPRPANTPGGGRAAFLLDPSYQEPDPYVSHRVPRTPRPSSPIQVQPFMHPSSGSDTLPDGHSRGPLIKLHRDLRPLHELSSIRIHHDPRWVTERWKCWDIRHPPFTPANQRHIRSRTLFNNTQFGSESRQFRKLGSCIDSPSPVYQLEITIDPDLLDAHAIGWRPIYVEGKPENQYEVCVKDVLNAIYRYFRTNITPAENSLLSFYGGHVWQQAYQEMMGRLETFTPERLYMDPQPMKRVDMLKGRTMFVGLELNSPEEEVVQTHSARLTLILASRRQIPI